MIRSTYNSYLHIFKVVPKFWNSNFLTGLESMAEEKKIYHFSSTKEFDKCVEDFKKVVN